MTRETLPLSALAADGDNAPRLRAAADRVADAVAREHWRRPALLIDHPLDFAGALFGALRAGAEPVLPPHGAPGLLESLRTHADALLTDASLAALPPVSAAHAPVVPGALAQRLFLYTSGSAGAPKLVDKPLQCLDAEVATLEALFGAEAAGRRVEASVSHQHIYGLLFRILWPLAAGRDIAARPIRFPEQLEALDLSQVLLVASPAFLDPIAARLDWRGALVFASGGPLAPTSAATINGAGACVEVFGSTETGGIGWRRTFDPRACDPWTPLRGVGVDEIDGRLSIVSPHLATLAPYRTNDRGSVMADGRFLISGRADRIVKIAEKRLSLAEAEAHLAAHHAVSAARLLALAEPGRTRLGAVIVLTAEGRDALIAAGKRALVEQLAVHMKARFEAVATPRRWRIVRALPVNSEGKTRQADLEALFAPDRMQVPLVIGRQAEALARHYRLRIPAGHPVFDGHFPDAPMVMGMLQIGWARHFAGQSFGELGAVTRVDSLKFQSIIAPEAEFTLSVSIDAGRTRVTFSLQGAAPHAKGVFVLEGAM